MSPPAAEIDFLGIRPQHRDHHFHLPPCPSPLEIPKTAWNISPDLLRSGVGTPRPWPVPFLDPSSRSTVEGLRGPTDASGSPLTIFYNGTVAVFNVPRDMAEAIMTLAERESTAAAEGPRARARAEELVRGGLQFSYLPLARQRSLQRFLEKRRERLTAAAPYTVPSALSSTDSDGDNVSHRKKYGKR